MPLPHGCNTEFWVTHDRHVTYFADSERLGASASGWTMSDLITMLPWMVALVAAAAAVSHKH